MVQAKRIQFVKHSIDVNLKTSEEKEICEIRMKGCWYSAKLTHRKLKKLCAASILFASFANKFVISPELRLFIAWLDKRSIFKS